MNRYTTGEKPSIESMLTSLRQLDTLYHSDSSKESEAALQNVVQWMQELFPGLTIAYAELHTVGGKRY
jgi:hypothetical protein